MELRRITGPDMRTALRMVREQLGPDAVILSNRRTANGVEIVAGPEDAWHAGAAVEAPPAAAASLQTPPLQAERAARLPAVPAATAPAAFAAGDGGLEGLHSELRELRDLLERRLGDMRIERLGWGPGIEGRAWRRLTRIGLPNALVHTLVRAMDAREGWDHAWSALCVRLAAGLTEAGDLAGAGGVVAAVGPTGAGKTTTLAKLAVRHVIEHGPAGLVLASFDASRIGGSDLLRALARLLEVRFLAGREGEPVAELLARAGEPQLLLLDTAGRRARDGAAGGVVAELGQLAGRVRSLLVLPATAQQAWLDAALADYRVAAPAAAVITRLDEAVSLGEVLGAVHAARLPIAYLSDGQEIPDDLQVAGSADLVARALALDPENEDNGVAASRDRRRAAGTVDAARIA